MNHLKRFCAVLMLLSALTLPTYGGDISCGGAFLPPCKASAPVEEPIEELGPEASTTEGEIFEAVLTLLQGVLAVF